MRYSFAASLGLLTASDLAFAAPAASGDGFPNPNSQQLLQIEKNAFGTLPNGPLPASLSEDTYTSLRLIAFNENFEVAFFNSVLNNLTSNNAYYNLAGVNKEFAIDTIKSIKAVEELHSLDANTALTKVGKKEAIEPCQYKFPTTDFKSAVGLAARFTDLVSGALQDIVFRAASTNNAALTPQIVAVVGDENEQVGWFRSVLGQRPNAQPFLTRAFRDYAFSVLHGFIVPHSCPNIGNIPLRVFQPLSAKDPVAKNQDLTFTFSTKATFGITGKNKVGYNPANFKKQYGNSDNWKKLSISYINGQNVPVTVPLKTFKLSGDSVTVTAAFPQEQNLFYGLVLASLTAGQKFATPNAVVDATLFGPAPLEVKETSVGPCWTV